MSQSFSYWHQKHIPQDISSSLKSHTTHSRLCHTHTHRQVIYWSLVSPARRQGPGYHSAISAGLITPLPFPPLPTWLCTSSRPIRKVLCNGFRKPHCIRSVVRMCFLLPDEARENRVGRGGYICVCVCVWKHAISHQIIGICHNFYERCAGEPLQRHKLFNRDVPVWKSDCGAY